MSLGYLIAQLANLYTFVIFVYCIFSWFPIPRDGIMGDINSFLAKLCDPYLDLFRKIVPTIGGAVDISPIIAIFVLQFIVSFLVRIL
ncbi:MAG: YggT family protein [Eggerthellaceae bacterium]|nr:YggT family protein [Eggerthellaceae bacterium]